VKDVITKITLFFLRLNRRLRGKHLVKKHVPGDTGILDEWVGFLQGRLVNADEDSYLLMMLKNTKSKCKSLSVIPWYN